MEPYNPDNPEDGRTEMDVAVALLRNAGWRIVKLRPQIRVTQTDEILTGWYDITEELK